MNSFCMFPMFIPFSFWFLIYRQKHYYFSLKVYSVDENDCTFFFLIYFLKILRKYHMKKKKNIRIISLFPLFLWFSFFCFVIPNYFLLNATTPIEWCHRYNYVFIRSVSRHLRFVLLLFAKTICLLIIDIFSINYFCLLQMATNNHHFHWSNQFYFAIFFKMKVISEQIIDEKNNI